MTETLKTLLLAGACALGLSTLAAPASAQFAERTIRMSNGVNQDHPVGNGVTAMTQCLAQRSGNRMRLQAFWGGALGGDLQATQALRSGTQEMVITSSSPLVGILPALGVFDLPFLFANEQEADRILDGAFGTMIADMLPAVGLVNLAWWENGFRNLTNSRRAVNRLEDLTGMRVRVMQNNIFLDTFRTAGANAVPMAFGEVFTALETRAIDGQENPFVTIDTSRFHEVQRFLSVTRHAYTPFLVLYSKQLWDRLSADEQGALTACAIIGRDEQRRVSRELSNRSLQNLVQRGMQVNEIAPAEMARMREAVRPVYDRHAEQIGRPIVERMVNELAAIRR
jgi:TRAP-type transport system periplasmic protein